MARNFMEMLKCQWDLGNFVGVSLDPRLGKIPKVCFPRECSSSDAAANAVLTFNKAIIENTKHRVCCYQMNLSSYDNIAFGDWKALYGTIDCIHNIAPDKPIILDANKADFVQETTELSAVKVFREIGVDAVTLNPYGGREALLPFLNYEHKGLLIFCKTSNFGSDEFQNLLTIQPGSRVEMRLHEYIAWRVASYWNDKFNCGLVMGANYPGELAEVRKRITQKDRPITPPIFIPGGTHGGGDPEENIRQAVKSGKDDKNRGFVIIFGRSVTRASAGNDFARAAQEKIDNWHKIVEKSRLD